MGSVGDELLVARLRADESRRWRRGASMASWAAPKWAQPRDRGTPRITKTGKGDAGNTPGRRRRRRRALSSMQSRRRPSRRRAGAASTRPRGAARPTARLRSRGSASTASGGVLSPRTECRENATRGRAKSKRTPQANRAARRRRRRGAATAARPGSCAGKSVAMRRYEEGRGPVQRGKRKRDLCTQRRVRRQEARQDRDDHDAQREFQRARAARRRAVGGGALLGQRPARHARALVDVVGVARGGVDVGVPAVPVAVQHHLDCPAAAALDSSAGAQVPQQRRAGRGRVPHRYATAARGLDGARTPNLECCDLG